MLERNISIEEIEHIVESGEVIDNYPDDEPFPSRLIFGTRQNRPLHVVVADETDSDITHVITAYQPDPLRWEDGFKRRKR
jgi:hypothetical protein